MGISFLPVGVCLLLFMLQKENGGILWKIYLVFFRRVGYDEDENGGLWTLKKLDDLPGGELWKNW